MHTNACPSHRFLSARTIGTSITSGGTGKTELSDEGDKRQPPAGVPMGGGSESLVVECLQHGLSPGPFGNARLAAGPIIEGNV